MKVAELIEKRRRNWQELEALCTSMEMRRKKKMGARAVSRFASLYRAACADLALADSYQLPPNIVEYLHQLVGRAHNQLYRSRSIDWTGLVYNLFVSTPRHIFADRCVQLCFFLFFGFFILSWVLAANPYLYPGFADEVVGRDSLDMMVEMHRDSVGHSGVSPSGATSYVQHNTSIGLQCFALGITVIGGIGTLMFNATYLGTVFGHMSSPTVPDAVRDNFFEFVLAHGPFELTAIVLAAGAGLRLGMALISPRHWKSELEPGEDPQPDEDIFSKTRLLAFDRIDSLKIASWRSLPIMGASATLFCLAAMIEAWISPSALPVEVKITVMIFCSFLLMIYFIVLGFPRGGESATR
ncbi:stage II sporulation protein M [Blastopirellula sp. JC732]|uniref:Stage II sporulation protein M n=1 Tax=Blastopirellula sediminis TaxID=2894196 RepID=A0A9X1SFV1_9BACT|nr:stage II sporulation protein M [Blastopirellula sediminis]MCC9609297.1 stage II sporulation protein M [Blastopirellula sediminis]MCC9627926.1 stage II sporulation protein M [Blastopirellula sediminis]